MSREKSRGRGRRRGRCCSLPTASCLLPTLVAAEGRSPEAAMGALWRHFACFAGQGLLACGDPAGLRYGGRGDWRGERRRVVRVQERGADEGGIARADSEDHRARPPTLSLPSALLCVLCFLCCLCVRSDYPCLSRSCPPFQDHWPEASPASAEASESRSSSSIFWSWRSTLMLTPMSAWPWMRMARFVCLST